MIVRVTVKHLRYLVALAEQRHFGKAAQACFVTQPTLSAALKELEDILGVQLVERTRRRVMVTSLGRQVVGHARVVLNAVAQIEAVAHEGREPLSGELTLGVIPTIGPYLLPRVMRGLRRRFPKLRLYLREDLTARLLEQLAEGRLDAALLALPYPMHDLSSLILFEDPFLAAFPPGHSLAARSRITAADLQAETLLLLEEGHCLRGHALELCGLPAANRGREFEATSLTTLVHMVDNGLGITLLPELAVRGGITKGTRLKTRSLADGRPARQVGLVWRGTSGRAAEFELLGRSLRELLQ